MSQAQRLQQELENIKKRYPVGFSSKALKRIKQIQRLLPYANTGDR